METQITWTGIEQDSLENCRISIQKSGIEVDSVIEGPTDGAFRIRYRMKLTADWRVLLLDMTIKLQGESQKLMLESDGHGHWQKDGQPVPEFDGCFDLDISFTPFTNSLPIKRLQMTAQARHEIDVVYIDVRELQVKRVTQAYTKHSDTEYKFENVPNDFEALITVNEQGLVLEYPGLFRGKAEL